MIRYALICHRQHGYESWFRDAAAYEDQAARQLLSCPLCGSVEVEKAVMAPQIARKDRGEEIEAATQPMALVQPQAGELITKLKALRAELLENSEDVGKRFVEEARRIHFGETNARPIHGQASLEDAKALLEDGVNVQPLPVLPDDWN